eukprot:3157053-Prymnesium_polylepis.3
MNERACWTQSGRRRSCSSPQAAARRRCGAGRRPAGTHPPEGARSRAPPPPGRPGCAEWVKCTVQSSHQGVSPLPSPSP